MRTTIRLLGFALLAALVNVAVSLGRGPKGLADPVALLATLAVTACALLVVLAGLWVALRLGARLLGLPSGGALPAAATTVLTIGAVFSILPRSGGMDLTALLLLAALSGSLGILGFVLFGWWPIRLPGWTLGAALVAGLAALIGVWRVAYPAEESVAPVQRASAESIRSGGHPVHVILLTIDTLRAGELGVYGSRSGNTPHLDAFGEQATVFLDARSSAAWTKPAMASMMTGLAPLAHGTLASASGLSTHLETLAEKLAQAGYRTAAFEGNPLLAAEFHFDQGFDEYHAYPRPELGRSIGAAILRRGKEPNLTTLLTDEAIAWIEAHEEEPFFLWVHYMDPHLPYEPPRRYLGEDVPALGKRFDDLHGVRFGRLLSSSERADIHALYTAEVRYVDAEVGRLLDALRSSGLFEDAVVVVASDHGEEFWEHGGYEHGHSLYDEILRVVLMFKAGRQNPSGCPGTLSGPVSIGSVTPSVLEAIGVAFDENRLSYPSLQSVCRSGSAAEPVVSTGTIYYEDGFAVALDGWKYIHHMGNGSEQLFRLTDDPGESRSAPDACPACLSRARSAVERHRAQSARLRERLGLSEAEDTDLSPERHEQLKALGYVE